MRLTLPVRCVKLYKSGVPDDQLFVRHISSRYSVIRLRNGKVLASFGCQDTEVRLAYYMFYVVNGLQSPYWTSYRRTVSSESG